MPRIPHRYAICLVCASGAALTWGCESDRRASDNDRTYDQDRSAWRDADRDRSTMYDMDQSPQSDLDYSQPRAHVEARQSSSADASRGVYTDAGYNRADDSRNATRDSAGESQRVLAFMHRTNQEEMRLGRLAKDRGGSAGVRDFGAQLDRDHTQADAKVTALASRLGHRLDNESDARSDASMRPAEAELRRLSGAEFDRAFSAKMLAAHRDAIRTLEGAVNNVDTETRALVQKTLISLREHERMAQELVRTSGLRATNDADRAP